MTIFLDPRIAPTWTMALTVAVLGTAGFLSTHRIAQSLTEQGDRQLAAQRAEQCRVLGSNNSVILGAYYWQPEATNADGWTTGTYLSEGIYICDLTGRTARIDRGGYAQHVVVGDASEINQILQRKLSDSTNPDSNEATRPLHDKQRANYESAKPKNKLFDLNKGESNE